MNNKEMLKIERIKNTYKAGMKVRCIEMEDFQAVPFGTEGIIQYVDDIGTIHVRWNNGSGLGLIVDVDRFEIIHEPENKYFEIIYSKRDENSIFVSIPLFEEISSSIIADVLGIRRNISAVFEDSDWWGIVCYDIPFTSSEIHEMINNNEITMNEREKLEEANLPEPPDVSSKSLDNELVKYLLRKHLNDDEMEVFPVAKQGFLFKFGKRRKNENQK